MISVSGKLWEQKKINENLVDKLKQDFIFSDILSRLIISRKFDNDKDIKDANKMGITDLNRKYELNEIIKGDSIFCSTGITSSEMLNGVVINNNEYVTETLVTHKSLRFKETIKRTNLIEE